MVHFVRKRLQVFVSSTFDDLREERQAAVEAILVAGHIPAGMELFTSGDESQMGAIKQWIDESDVYLLVLGGRYGSIEPISKKSYTRIEYEYALQISKPMFACVVTERALEERVKRMGSRALETGDPAGLREFRAAVLTKLVRFWDDPKDIKITVGETLSQLARRDDLVGWVRPSDTGVDVNSLADEIARLSKENSQLRERTAMQQEPQILGFPFAELIDLLNHKDLLSILLKTREKLASDSGLSGRALSSGVARRCEELKFIGIIETKFNGEEYKLTDQGRRFLSRLDLMSLRSESNAQ